MTIYLDCDGTWIDLYGIENWLDYLLAEDIYPYANAKPLVNLSLLARTIHELQRKGVKVGIISWLSKGGSEAYNAAVDITKRKWFKRHIPSVTFDEVHIVKYGTPKALVPRKRTPFFSTMKKRTATSGKELRSTKKI